MSRPVINKAPFIHCTRIETLLGTMMACATVSGVCSLQFTDSGQFDHKLRKISRLFSAEIIQGKNSHLALLETELDEYFGRKRKVFTVPLHIYGNEFQKQVWEILLKIEYGKTLSYGAQARMLGIPEAVRAVAKTNGGNRIAILIPCHRVIGSDGKLTGYGGGLWRKQKLLELEGVLSKSLFGP